LYTWSLLFSLTKPFLTSAVSTETSFQGDFPGPPPYSIATSLPTYDEAEKAKAAALAASAMEVLPRVKRHTQSF
ncbi:Nedd4 interacting protein, partial [Goodea atripinnis]